MDTSGLSTPVVSTPHTSSGSWVLDQAQQRNLVSTLTSETLEEVAPEEMGVFAAYERWYVDGVGTPPPQQGKEEQSGFGVELLPALLPLVLQAVKVAVGWILQAGSQSVVQEWVKRHLGHSTSVTAAPDALSPDAQSPDALSPETLREIRDQIITVLMTTNADPADAGVVADAVVGRLATR